MAIINRSPRLANVRFLSPHPPEECVRRLEETVAKGMFFRFSGKPVEGSVSDTEISIRKKLSYRNTCQFTLDATLEPEGSGTVIAGTLGRDWLWHHFDLIWILGVAVILVVMEMDVFGGFTLQHLPELLMYGLGIWFVGWICARWGRYATRDEDEFLKRHVIETLDAREVSAPVPDP